MFQIIQQRGWTDYYRLQKISRTDMPDLREHKRVTYDFLESETYRKQHLHEQADGTFTCHWFIDGMTCAACVWLIEKGLKQRIGVHEARAFLDRGELSLSVDARFDHRSAAEELDALGYQVKLSPHQGDNGTQSTELLRLGISGALAANMMLMTMPLYTGGLESDAFGVLFGGITAVLSIPVILYAARPFFVKAWAGLRNRRLSLDLPISIGLVSAECLSIHQLLTRQLHHLYFDSMAMLVFFLLIGRFIQQRGVNQALRHTRQLVATMPQIVQRWDGVSWSSVTAQQIEPGDLIRIESGNLVPVDGQLRSDDAVLSLHVVSGESEPIHQREGSPVPAGAINLGCSLEICASSRFSDSDSERLRDLANRLKSQVIPASEQTLASVFTTTVLITALAAFLTHLDHIEFAFRSALTILIVACPCALALARPTALATAFRQASNLGIWVRSTDAWRRAPMISRVIFDKTGVLTEGCPGLIRSHWLTPREHWLKGAIIALERDLNHPIAQAFRTAFAVSAEPTSVTEIRVTPGQGVQGRVDGHHVVLTAPHACTDQAIHAAFSEFPTSPTATQVLVLIDGQPAALFEFEDRPRPEAPSALADLSHMEVSVLSGDRPGPVQSVCHQLGIERFQAAMNPTDKLQAVTELVHTGHQVAVIGDGLNDMGALGTATIGVTHAQATEAAIQMADVVLARPDLRLIPLFLELSRRAQRATKQGITLSLFYNVITVFLAWQGLIGPLWAAILMPLSSLSVIAIANYTVKGDFRWAS
ncbi:MAG: cation-translocating P-type ATPase [Acidobacteria bacterium]|nr:cation-translocating P-type ATPase [Acidobacteriota bacterium]